MSDGKDLTRRLRELLDEESTSTWLDQRTCYDFFYEAALDFVDRSGCLRATQTITTVASQSEYDLNPDFLRLYLRNQSGDYFLKYSDGSNTTFLNIDQYDDIYYQNSPATSRPTRFSIIDATLPDIVIGTATSSGAASGGSCTLTSTSSNFSDVEAGDPVHNTTDGSTGIVLSKTSTTALVTALFGGTANDWTSSDAFTIQPGARFKLVLDPIPDTSGHTVYVPYVQRPAPVYSDYGTYRFVNPSAIVKYAFFLFKYRDREPNFGDAMYKFWEAEIDKKAESLNRGQRPLGFRVNFKRRNY
jgi:hypothetical protein